MCGLEDFVHLLKNCVDPRCDPDHERLGLDRYDEAFDMMIKEFFDSFDSDKSGSITREELKEPLARVLRTLVKTGQLDKDSTLCVVLEGRG